MTGPSPYGYQPQEPASTTPPTRAVNMNVDEKLNIIAKALQLLLVGQGPHTFEWMTSKGSPIDEVIQNYDHTIETLEVLYNKKYITYRNSPENAEQIGWNTEYCIGDTDADFVTHNHDRGLFIFHN